MDSRFIIKFPNSARNRNPEEYKGTVFYHIFVFLAPFYNFGTNYNLIADFDLDINNEWERK